MADDGETEMESPVATGVPPHETVYQFHVAPGGSVPFTSRDALLPAQMTDGATSEAGSAGVAFTFTTVFTHAEKQLPISART